MKRLAWLYRFSYEDAEQPERWFNRAFLAGYAVSGAVTIYTWEHTVSACTNQQYNHPELYSCPSHGRIASTWFLGLLLVATGFASRFVLWRRLRASYVPLVVAVFAIGCVAAWLLTHHPHWGVRR